MNISIKDQVKSGLLKQQKLVLNISGDDVNHKFINCIRRLSKLYVPTYAFCAFEFIENTSVFNNDMMKLRLLNITPQNLNVDIDYLDPIYYPNDANPSNENRQRHKNDNVNYEFHINVENTSGNKYKNYTTDDMKFYLNGKQVKSNIANPCLIIQLKKGEKFNCRGKAVLGTGMGISRSIHNQYNEIWAASGNTYYKELKPNEYLLTIESKGQMDEFEILRKCCVIAVTKLDILIKTLNNNNEKNGTKLEFTIDDDDSLPGLLGFELQNCKDVKFASCARKVVSNYVTTMKVETYEKNVITCFIDTINKVIKIFNVFEKTLAQLKLQKKLIKK